MAAVTLNVFREKNGDRPFLEWYESLSKKAKAKCQVRLERLKQLGNELRRPEAEYLRDAIYELRIKYLRLNYRILYFFDGRHAVVVSHGLKKEKSIPPSEIELAIDRRRQFLLDPVAHSWTGEFP